MKTRLLVLLVAIGALAAACGDSTDVANAPTLPTNPGTEVPDTSLPDTSLPDPSDPDLDATATRPVDGVDTFAIADLTVVVSHPDHDDLTFGISCLGDTATIDAAPLGVDPELACTALLDAAVVTRLVEGVPADQVCTEIYGGPDVAVITGTLGSDTIDATINRTNGCGIDDWDSVLGDILPPATGVTS